MKAPVIRVRSGMGSVVRAEFLGLEQGRVRVRYLKEVQGRTPESLIHMNRLVDGIPDVTGGGEGE